MEENSIKIKDALVLNERIFSAAGIWPLKNTYVKYTIVLVYYSLHLIMLYADLFDVLGDPKLLVDNLMENLVITLAFITMFIIRHNKSLARTIAKIKEEMMDDRFENIEEKRIYYYYNNISCVFTKYVTYGAGITAVLLYVSPMVQFIQLYKDHGNSSTTLKLPFRGKIFFDYTDYRVFILLYLYQMPIPYTGLYHVSLTCLVVNLVLHVCGRLSILSNRIRNIPTKSVIHFESTIAEIVKTHLEIIHVKRLRWSQFLPHWEYLLRRMGKAIEDAFSFILLLDLGECILRLAFCMYIFLAASNSSNVTNIFTLLLYVVIMTFLLYSYCYAGEQLIQECSKVQDAYYYCNWEDMPNKCKKSLIICMIHGQRTLHITAGKFYNFSLYAFTDVMKTCLAYVSMLRTMI